MATTGSTSLRGAALRDELVKLAEKRGLAVRREGLPRGVSGGLCRVKGVATLFVDERAAVDAQVEVLTTALRRFDWSDVFVHPALRKLVGAGLGDEEPLEAPPSDAGEVAPAPHTDNASEASVTKGRAKANSARGRGAAKPTRALRR